MSGVPDTGIYAFQFRVNFFRYSGANSRSSFSIKWKRGSKGENKGNTPPVKIRNADGDYVINEVFSFQSTMQRKDEAKAEKGFHHKWLDLTVVQHSKGDKKKKLFQSELDLSIVLPPQSDTTPHILLCNKQRASLSLSFGYKKVKSVPSKSSIFSACTSAPAPPPSGSRMEKRRSRSAGWWVCGSTANSPPNGRSTSVPKNRVMFAEVSDDTVLVEPKNGEDSIESLDNKSIDNDDQVPDEMQIQVNGTNVSQLPKQDHLGIPSYPAAPKSDADMMSMRSMISTKSSILGTSSIGSQSIHSGLIQKQRSKFPVIPILRDRPGKKKKEPGLCI